MDFFMKGLRGLVDKSNLVVVEEVSKQYLEDFPPAVSHLSLNLKKGEILAILGPSGCGKTTTLRLIAGFEAPDSGRIYLDGEPMTKGRVSIPPEARRIGMVFQDYALFPHLTLLENVTFGIHTGSRKQKHLKGMDVLEMVGMSGLAKRYPHEISGGQQQRVALARALAPRPLVILLDEPFSNLDTDMRSEMRREVEKIFRSSGMSAIVVTHDQEEAFSMADRVGVLNGGTLEQLAPPEILYHVPATRFVANFVGEADFLQGEVRDGIVTEIGTFPDGSGLPYGTRVEMMIRPDDVDFEICNDGNGLIGERIFRGPENLYSIIVSSGLCLRSSQSSDRIVPEGTGVKLLVHPTHIVIFPL